MFSLLLGFSFLLSSCGDSPDDVAEDMMETMDEVVSIVKGVNEGGDAKEAIEELNGLKDEVKSLSARMKEIDEGHSDEEKKEFEKKMEEKHGDKLEKTMGDLMGEVLKLSTSSEEGAKDVAQAVTELMSEMK